jgi:CBS domain-containing protein
MTHPRTYRTTAELRREAADILSRSRWWREERLRGTLSERRWHGPPADPALLRDGDAHLCVWSSQHGTEEPAVRVRDAMTRNVLTITPGRSLREAAQFLTDHNVGAVVIMDPEEPGPGIFTERDLTRSVGRGEDPDSETVHDHLTANAAFADADWDLGEAADTMAAGGFRHLVVVSDGEVEGIISMRDIMRVWRPGTQ